MLLPPLVLLFLRLDRLHYFQKDVEGSILVRKSLFSLCFHTIHGGRMMLLLLVSVKTIFHPVEFGPFRYYALRENYL